MQPALPRLPRWSRRSIDRWKRRPMSRSPDHCSPLPTCATVRECGNIPTGSRPYELRRSQVHPAEPLHWATPLILEKLGAELEIKPLDLDAVAFLGLIEAHAR